VAHADDKKLIRALFIESYMTSPYWAGIAERLQLFDWIWKDPGDFACRYGGYKKGETTIRLRVTICCPMDEEWTFRVPFSPHIRK